MRPTGRLMSGIPLLFVREYALKFANVPFLLGLAQLAAITAVGARSQTIMYTRSYFNLLVHVLAPISYRK